METTAIGTTRSPTLNLPLLSLVDADMAASISVAAPKSPRQPPLPTTRANLDITAATAAIGIMSFDIGYCSEDNLRSAPGPDRLIATAKSHAMRQAATGSPAQRRPPRGQPHSRP